jgi:hypothetical protein
MRSVKRPPDAKKAAKTGRDQRLAAALRENLRRRKAQARGRDAGAVGGKPLAKEKPR